MPHFCPRFYNSLLLSPVKGDKSSVKTEVINMEVELYSKVFIALFQFKHI